MRAGSSVGGVRGLGPGVSEASLRLPGTVHTERLDNGLSVVVVENRLAPVATVALFYRAGTRDEAAGQGGTAHFLEHMMFKGSARYGPGEVDRLTQRLGGSNNAFTSHDVTAYYFQFAPDRWSHALDIEADRMAGLLLEPAAVDSERRVILEEISMYEGDPWSALDTEVTRRLFDGHPYGLPVLGSRDELRRIGAAELAEFHRRHYRSADAVLVLAGDVGVEALERARERFGDFPADAESREPVPRWAPPSGLSRLERRHGTVARMMLALPAPPASQEDHAGVRMLLALLTTGRSAPLQRALVEDERLCLWVTSELREHEGPGLCAVVLEAVEGIARERIEGEVWRALEALREGVFDDEALERARRLVLADWVFGHERVHQQALAAGFAAALFDLDHPRRYLRRILGIDREELQRVAGRWLDPQAGGVLGWSLPSER